MVGQSIHQGVVLSRGQVTRKIKRVLQKSLVDHTVAERQHWAKFGQEKGKKAGPDRATTTVGENVYLKLSAGNKVRRHPTRLGLLHADRARYIASNRSQSHRRSKS